MKIIQKYLVLIIISFIFFTKLYAQCGQELIYLAEREVKTNETILKSYLVAFSESWRYQNVAKYSIILNKDVKYRFIVKNSAEYPGKIMVKIRYLCPLSKLDNLEKYIYHEKEIFVKDRLGSVEYFRSFDFLNTKSSGIYQLHISFLDKKKGCGAVLVVYEK